MTHEDLEIENARLKGMIEGQEHSIAPQDHTVKQAMESSGKVVTWLSAVIGLVLLIGSIGVNWGITTAQLDTVTTHIAEIKDDRDKKEALLKAETDKLKTDIIELKMKGAADNQWRLTTTTTLSEIKVALEKLANRGR